MDVPDHTGISTVLFSGLGTCIASALAVWQRHLQHRNQSDETDEADEKEMRAQQVARSNLDTAQQLFLEQLLADNKRYRADAAIWEARARRIDRIAHRLRDSWNGERFTRGEPSLSELPLLEDPIVEKDKQQRPE